MTIPDLERLAMAVRAGAGPLFLYPERAVVSLPDQPLPPGGSTGKHPGADTPRAVRDLVAAGL